MFERLGADRAHWLPRHHRPDKLSFRDLTVGHSFGLRQKSRKGHPVLCANVLQDSRSGEGVFVRIKKEDIDFLGIFKKQERRKAYSCQAKQRR